ncbi:hypothetical protein [Flavobacterium terrigena]|uniref:Uncharacterized protein n=1 Tax=Flavobacterium terrigena TaxID=402734 RepID=A0A1H6QWE5_9FLAO|nr:hypothetical protein [Flavobacterium terrigena]SEI44517.1 hypothetical protein SAMN05660918_0613 [Flavobacterium terrigena]
MKKTNGIEITNIILIIVSAIFAFICPFQTFLLVYAFLGPLHYLTEINWLQQRNYFLQNKTDVNYLFIPIIAIGSIVYIPSLAALKPVIPFLLFFTLLVSIFNSSENIKLYRNWKFILLLIVGIATSFYFRNYFHTFFSIFLPSLIHVFIFTGIFILSGFLKTRNNLSLLTFITFLAMSLFLLNFNLNTFSIEENIHSKYQSFEKLNQTILSIFGEENNTKHNIYFSNFGIKLMQFIAFAYTYHYLNWFSKTSIIQWHKTTKTKFSVIILIWIVSVLLYLYNYKTGLYWLYLLSLTHVILEFPLNITSVKSQFKNNHYQ